MLIVLSHKIAKKSTDTNSQHNKVYVKIEYEKANGRIAQFPDLNFVFLDLAKFPSNFYSISTYSQTDQLLRVQAQEKLMSVLEGIINDIYNPSYSQIGRRFPPKWYLLDGYTPEGLPKFEFSSLQDLVYTYSRIKPAYQKYAKEKEAFNKKVLSYKGGDLNSHIPTIQKAVVSANDALYYYSDIIEDIEKLAYFLEGASQYLDYSPVTIRGFTFQIAETPRILRTYLAQLKSAQSLHKQFEQKVKAL